MARVIFVQTDGSRTEIDAPLGESVMSAATSNLVPGIIGDCGGVMACATCHVFVDEDWLDRVGQRDGDENDMLDITSEESTEHSRLSCQINVARELDGLVLNVPASQQ
ncbi:2Fe-2S iron-sulfur cluster-binding protein [soil metagenome]